MPRQGTALITILRLLKKPFLLWPTVSTTAITLAQTWPPIKVMRNTYLDVYSTCY